MLRVQNYLRQIIQVICRNIFYSCCNLTVGHTSWSKCQLEPEGYYEIARPSSSLLEASSSPPLLPVSSESNSQHSMRL